MVGIEAGTADTPVLRGVDVSAADGELVAIIGPSGAGKTTLLKVVAGVEPARAGRVLIDGVDVTDLRPGQRNVAMVFQERIMYPFRDVAGNVGFPLEVRHEKPAEISRRVRAEGRALHIERLMDRDPGELSAGHQQLVQIARALVRAPSLFLMDEPLARLDAKLRVEMRAELRMMQQGYGVTTLYVTNDPTEAMALSDRLVVLVDGRVAQTGAPADVYARPVSLTVAQLTGDLSTLPFTVVQDGAGRHLERDGFKIRVWSPAAVSYTGLDVLVGVRPEHVRPDPDGVPAVVERVVHHGPHVITRCRIGTAFVDMRTERPVADLGSTVRVTFDAGHLFDPVDGRAVAWWD